jgi:putative oxidoreductase
MNPVYRLFATVNSFGPTVLRWFLGFVLMVHGGQKIFGWLGGSGWHATMAQLTAADGLRLPFVVAAGGLLLGAVAAGCLVLGLFTRLAALAVLAIMVCAIYGAKWEQGFLVSFEFEYPFALALIAVSLVFSGAGKVSADRAITRQLLPPGSMRLLGEI